ncbi:MAG: hypothetical protein CTY16_14570 [Methylobacter sp.]|nr:MAG: hypothetical protein CTY16_14570 [Methylobacter sp.]
MLDTVCAQNFNPHIGKACRLSHPDGLSFDLVIDSVTETPKLQRPQDNRTPFSVLLTGDLTASFHFGTFTIEVDGVTFLSDVYIERVAPPWGLESDKAFYQIIFN